MALVPAPHKKDNLPEVLPKSPKFGKDKVKGMVLGRSIECQSGDSLLAWVEFYYRVHVKGSPPKTEQAKQKDLQKFLTFVTQEVGHDHVDSWTPAVTCRNKCHFFCRIICQ